MIYMVELDYRDTAREHDWHTWYLQHVTGLILNVPGFRGSQRFRALTPTPSPWLALHEVAGPEVFDQPAYKGHGGPASTGEWKDRHTNWQRNLFSGCDVIPEVAADAHLLVGEGDAAMPEGVAWMPLACIGLDRSCARRTMAIVPPGRLTARMFALDGVRVFKPITPQVRA